MTITEDLEATITLRPQPVGVFPFPAALLVLPPAEEDDANVLGAWLRGARPACVPDAWEFFAVALDGRLQESAQMALADASLLGVYNAFVLTGDARHLVALRARAQGELAVLSELAAFCHGLRDSIPEAGALAGELLALYRMLHAARMMEDGELELAFHLLCAATESARELSPVYAAQLLIQASESLPDRTSDNALHLYRQAARLLEHCGDSRLKAEVLVLLGQSLQERAGEQAVVNRAMLIEATNAYQAALRCGLSPESNADLFATTQNNLGLAYLAMPMNGEGSRLRSGVAVQSFREALKVYDRERTPEQWISTQSNLANALQHMHSAHPAENLELAVRIYDELLEMRPRALDPVGHARLLANQANALAHLAIFAPALAKATEAHKLLHWHQEPELANSLLELTENINQRIAASSEARG